MSFLEVNNLIKHFGGVRAVHQCSFVVEKNTITALVGPNGAGKTTVFNLLSGFVSPDSGTIIFDGKDLTGLPDWKRARAGISRTFQLSRLFKNLSIEDNLLLALREHDDKFWKMMLRGQAGDESESKQINEIMGFVGLEKDPKTIVTDLSYGQQKIFDLARALANPHSLLLLDEPVAGVNPVLRDKFKSLLGKLKKEGDTVLVIEHDMDFVRSVADFIIVMDQGSVLTQGEPEDALKDERVLEAYLGR